MTNNIVIAPEAYQFIKDQFTVNGVTYGKIPSYYTKGKVANSKTKDDIKSDAVYVRLGDDGKWYQTRMDQDAFNINYYFDNKPLIDRSNEIIDNQWEQGDGHKIAVNQADARARQRWFSNEDATKFLLTTAGLGMLGAGVVTAPLATTLGLVGGYGGAKAVDAGMQKATGQTWGQWMNNKTGLPEWFSEFTNPGALIGGWKGAKLGGQDITTYQAAYPYIKNLIIDSSNAAGLMNTLNRTLKATPKFINPKFMRQMMQSPDMIKSSDLWWWSNFSKNQWRNLQNNWAKEADKGKYYFSNPPNPGNSTQQISSDFETGRYTASGIDKSKNLAQSIIDNYKQKMEAITDPVLKHIAETSPQYLNEVYEQQLRGGATPDFVRNLIKKANSYRRAMRGDNLTSEDFLTYKGRRSDSNLSTIDVEGENMSGNYGSVQGYFEGQPELKGDISTWWDQRIPKGVNSSEVITAPNGSTFTLESRVTPGIHSVEPYIKQITNLEPQGEQLPIIQSFYNTYRRSGLPLQYVNYPIHQVFYGRTNTMLPNFKVTVGNKPLNFNYGKGYKNGGIIKNLLTK